MSRVNVMLAVAALAGESPHRRYGRRYQPGRASRSGRVSGSVGGADMTGFSVDSFTTRDDLGGSVKSDDPASFSLPMYGSDGTKLYINTLGTAPP